MNEASEVASYVHLVWCIQSFIDSGILFSIIARQQLLVHMRILNVCNMCTSTIIDLA